MKKKYQKPIIITFTIIFIIIVMVVSFLAYTQNLIRQSILTNLGEITKQDAEKLENKIQEHKRILETIANEVKEKAKSEQEIFDIYNRNSGNEEFSRIAILYKNGTTITSDGKIVDLSEEVNQFFSVEEIQISKNRISKVNNEEINIYSKKILFQNEEVVILLVIDNDKYKNLFTQNIFYGEGIECIITNTGEIIANSKNEENNTNIFQDLKNIDEKEFNKVDEIQSEILENQEGQIYYKIQEKNYYISYKKLSIGEWRLVIIIPENIIAKNLNQLLEAIIIVSIIVIIITLLVTIYILLSNIKKKEKLYKLAYIDPITGLGNYNDFLRRIEEKIEDDSNKMIIILDIDKFKTFNKKYGHIKGNELLKRVGEETKKIVRKTDIVCRLGNDVFGIFLDGEVDVKKITNRLNKNITKIQIEDKWYNIHISIGIYVYHSKEKDIQGIIDKAIIAHDSVKGKYNEKYGVYTDKFEQQLSRESEIENMMEDAIKNKEFEVYYQPQISTKTQKIEGAEALVRWNKDGKVISPGEFIPIFEKNGFIINLDKYIFEKACENIREMKKEFKEIPKISVNISKESLVNNNFLIEYEEIMKKYNVMSEEIEFEITERTTVSNDIDIQNVLNEIKKKGFCIAIDDFGTGYSSLNMLETLPIDTLKIDKSFIDKINIKEDNTSLIEAIMFISQKLHLKTVAEGVETIEQVNYLKKWNCDLIQGYVYSKPLRFEELKERLRNGSMLS